MRLMLFGPFCRGREPFHTAQRIPLIHVGRKSPFYNGIRAMPPKAAISAICRRGFSRDGHNAESGLAKAKWHPNGNNLPSVQPTRHVTG